MSKVVAIKTENIKLGQVLKFAGITLTGGEAKAMIKNGLTLVNGEKVTNRSRLLFPGDVVRIEGEEPFVIEREAEE